MKFQIQKIVAARESPRIVMQGEGIEDLGLMSSPLERVSNKPLILNDLLDSWSRIPVSLPLASFDFVFGFAPRPIRAYFDAVTDSKRLSY